MNIIKNTKFLWKSIWTDKYIHVTWISITQNAVLVSTTERYNGGLLFWCIQNVHQTLIVPLQNEDMKHNSKLPNDEFEPNLILLTDKKNEKQIRIGIIWISLCKGESSTRLMSLIQI